jgi:putative DNA methylase
MSWDYCESNVFSDSSGNFYGGIDKISKVLAGLISPSMGQRFSSRSHALISTDPPYYDNIGYADLSDFFYVWLKGSLGSVWPELFRRLTTPKNEELVATPDRQGGKEQAEAFFIQGMGEALTAMR